MNKRIAILVFVEGESEKNYLSGLISKVPFIRNGYIIKTKICKPNKKMIQEIKNFSIENKISFEKKYLIIDKDIIDNNEFEVILSLAKQENIKVLFSNPCFEVFLLLHYKEFNGEQSKQRYYNELNREMTLSKFGGYERNKAKLDDYEKYDELIPGKLKEYLKNFKKLEAHHKRNNSGVLEHLLNPYTNINTFFDDIGLTQELEK